MPPPPVTIYVTSLTSQPKVRHNTDLLHRSLKGLEIPYEAFDLVMDQVAKTRWQRAKPPGQVIGLPGYLVGGEWVGTMDDFEYAVESQTLPSFLKQDQDLAAHESDSGPSGASGSGQVGEKELERLMREMSDADLDALAGELGVGDAAGKVGLMVPEGAEPVISSTSTSAATINTSTEEGAGGLESVGIKGTGEVIPNPDLELEKKFAEVEIGSRANTGSEVKGESGEGEGVVEKLKRVEEVLVGAKADASTGEAGKEKLD